MNKKIFLQMLLIVIVSNITVALVTQAWTEPQFAPPKDDTLRTPVNLGSDYQEKLGPLLVNKDNKTTGFVVRGGRTGLNTDTPDATLDVHGGVIIGSGSNGTGKALCWKSDKEIGYCQGSVSSSGSCSCTGDIN